MHSGLAILPPSTTLTPHADLRMCTTSRERFDHTTKATNTESYGSPRVLLPRLFTTLPLRLIVALPLRLFTALLLRLIIALLLTPVFDVQFKRS